MKINFRQGVVSHQETGFLEPNGSGGVRIAASTRSTTITLAHRDTNYTHSEDNNVENAWPGPFPAGNNYYLYWEFNQLTFLRSFGYTTLEPVSQSVPPGSGNSPIVGIVPGVASPIAFGSFEVEGHYVLPSGKTFAVIGSTGSPNNDGTYTVQNAVYNLVTGNTTITVNEAVIAAVVSGSLTLDIDSTGLPLFVNGRNWYDTANNIQYVLDNTNQWIEVLRVFAANLFNGTTFIGMSQAGSFVGTQIGDNSSIASGRVLFGDAGNPIRRDDNTLFTTEDQFFTNQSRVDAIRLESNVSRAQAFSSSLAQFGIVAWRDDGQIASATYDDTGSTVVGVLTESLLVGQVGAVITQGTVTNSAWNWTSTLSVGAALWIQNGELVGVDPNLSDPITYTEKQVPVARVLSVDTIIFEQGLGGVGPQGPTGALADLPVATTSTLGGVFLSDTAINPLVPIAVGENHPIIAGGPYAAATHSHSALQISFTPGNNIAASDVQNAIATLAIEKINLSGGTMTGILTLSASPTTDFQAATKAYVDALFQGIDAKEACLVGTTPTLGDIGGLYSSIGGTGGTGAITAALISKLDGTLDVDFALAVAARILVKDQTDAKENGIYVVTAIGVGSPPTTIDIERASDFDSNEEIRAGNYTVLTAGLEQAGKGWVLTDIHPNDDIDLNVHDIIWTLVSSATAYTGDPNTIDIDITNVISVIPASAGGTVDALRWNSTSLSTTGAATGKPLVYNAVGPTYEPALFSLPAATGTSAEVLTSNGDGTSSWLSVSAGGLLNIVEDLTPQLGGDLDLNGFDIVHAGTINITSQVQPFGQGNITITAADSGGGFGSAGGSVNIVAGGVPDANQVAGSITLTPGFDASPATAGSTILINGRGDGTNDNAFNAELQMRAIGGIYATTISVPSLIANTNFTLPPTNGAGGEALITNGSGVTYWGGVVTNPLTADLDTNGYSFITIDAVEGKAQSIFLAPGNNSGGGNGGGGDISIVAGYNAYNPGGFTGGNGGNVTITAGDNNSTVAGAGGSVTIKAGSTAAAGFGAQPGNVSITAGYGDGPFGGSVIIWGGKSTSANSFHGPIQIRGQDNASGYGGDVIIVAGDSSFNQGRNITLQPGSGAGAGANYQGSVAISGAGGNGAGIIRIDGQSGYHVELSTGTLAADTTFTLPTTDGTLGDILTAQGAGVTAWQASSTPSTKPAYEKQTITGSPVSDIVNTTVSTTATSGSPLVSSLQVFRNGMMQEEDLVAGSPIAADFVVTGANQLTFATGTLQANDTIIIYVFN